ncbi:hypothetical protein ACWNYQ_00560 [Candidatus Vidania fulgoroideorum]
MNILKCIFKNKKKKIFGSKSITNRILFFSFFFKKIFLKNLLISNDTKQMLKVLIFYGYKKNFLKNKLRIKFFKKLKGKYINIENAGTVLRPIISLFIYKCYKDVIIDGNKNMKKRPLKGLIKSLYFFIKVFKRINFLKKNFYLPIRIKKGYSEFKRHYLFIKEKKSSQYITSILLTSCFYKKKFFLIIKKSISFNYIILTLELLKEINLKFLIIKKNIIKFNNYKNFKKNEFLIYNDIISSSYYFLDCYFLKKKITIRNFLYKKIINESCLINVLKKIGIYIYKNNFIKSVCYEKIYKFIKINCIKIIDFSICLPILCSCKLNKIFIYNIYNWKFKECNRIKAISKEIKKKGNNVYYGKNWIYTIFKKNRKKIIFDSYNDHRISMSLNSYSIKKNCYIQKPNSVKKTFPIFYDQ